MSIKKISNILKSVNIHLFGVCNFDDVKNSLIPCAAKNRLPRDPKRVIVALFPYKVEDTPPKNISRYAAVPDYHAVCGKMLENATNKLKTLFPENQFAYFIDNSPIPEVQAAVLAGLGVRGQNGLLITKRFGSYVFIGEIVTDLELPYTSFKEDCPGCGRCKSMCPTKMQGREVCLSHITQKKKELSKEETTLIHKHKTLWGCDICQECCPLNKKAEKTYIKEFIEGYRPHFAPGEDSTGRAYAWRGEKPIFRNFKIINPD